MILLVKMCVVSYHYDKKTSPATRGVIFFIMITRGDAQRVIGRGIIGVLTKAAKIGYKLGRDKRYKRMGAKGATGHYRRLPRPWEG